MSSQKSGRGFGFALPHNIASHTNKALLINASVTSCSVFYEMVNYLFKVMYMGIVHTVGGTTNGNKYEKG